MTREESNLVDWDDVLVAFLRDPPDKAIAFHNHETRAALYASAAVGRPIDADARLGTRIAEMAEQIPVPIIGARGSERAVALDLEGRLQATHPLCGETTYATPGFVEEQNITEIIRAIVDGLDTPRARFMAIWRLLPEHLQRAFGGDWARLPTDPRTPDHGIWRHADTVARFHAANADTHGAAFLSFALGPVQPFVETARSVRDLWSDSAILSWMSFGTMLPVIESCGPTALVFPYLRGLPLMDLWLRREAGLGDQIPEPDVAARRIPCVPNRFLAMVPWGSGGKDAAALAQACETAAREQWRGIADAVRAELGERLAQSDSIWDKRWEEQIDGFFDIRTAILPLHDMSEEKLARLSGEEAFVDAWPEAAKVRGLATAIPANHRPSHSQQTSGHWQALIDLSARLMEAQRSVRHVPHTETEDSSGDSPPKCTLMGSYEQMGPDDLTASGKFWDQASQTIRIGGVRLRPKERFCAVALAKRFSAPLVLTEAFDLPPQETRFPDTATIAAAEWLKEAGIEPDTVRKQHDIWSGQWLHWRTNNEDCDEDPVPAPVWKLINAARHKSGPAPSYYAILKMDADRMGAWLRGEKNPSVEESLHPDLARYYRHLDDDCVTPALEAKRPMAPATHAAISEALTNFAARVVPGIVENHTGTLIYAGGDDVLALLPVRTALRCARALECAFRGDPTANGGAPKGYFRIGDEDLLMMGPKATLSAGLAVVHTKEDLRYALRTARKIEAEAKKAGRNAIRIAALRRSGEHAVAGCGWDMLDWFDGLRQAFVEKASDRWAYRLRSLLPTLGGAEIPRAAVEAEIRRQVLRAESEMVEAFSATRIADAFADYDKAMCERRAATDHAASLRDFITLCQTASFMARERDR